MLFRSNGNVLSYSFTNGCTGTTNVTSLTNYDKNTNTFSLNSTPALQNSFNTDITLNNGPIIPSAQMDNSVIIGNAETETFIMNGNNLLEYDLTKAQEASIIIPNTIYSYDYEESNVLNPASNIPVYLSSTYDSVQINSGILPGNTSNFTANQGELCKSYTEYHKNTGQADQIFTMSIAFALDGGNTADFNVILVKTGGTNSSVIQYMNQPNGFTGSWFENFGKVDVYLIATNSPALPNSGNHQTCFGQATIILPRECVPNRIYNAVGGPYYKHIGSYSNGSSLGAATTSFYLETTVVQNNLALEYNTVITTNVDTIPTNAITNYFSQNTEYYIGSYIL